MFKRSNINTLLLVGVGMYFTGCATINDGIANGVAYTYHSATGIQYPKKSGKIYIESTTTKDTQNVTPLNAQLYGFDAVVAQNIMQCDSLPELTDVLMEHGWEITKNKEEADYHISTSVLYCGYADKWLKESSRDIPLKNRLMTKEVRGESLKNNLNITEEQIESENEEVLKKVMPKIDVTKLFKNYFNVFAYKYKNAPDHIKALAQANIEDPNQTLKDPSSLPYHTIQGGTDIARSGMQNANAIGVGLVAAGMLMGANGQPMYSGYKTEIKIYDPSTKQTKKEYIGGLIPMNSSVENVGTYKKYKYNADVLASGLFYK